jgi:hypothetical protein
MAVHTGIPAGIGKHLHARAITEQRAIGNTTGVVIAGFREAGKDVTGIAGINKHQFKIQSKKQCFAISEALFVFTAAGFKHYAKE